MKRLLLLLIVPALVAAFTLTSDTSYSKGQPDEVLPEYLALGDSLGVGFGASDPATKGYVPLFRDFLESTDGLNRNLFLNNLSIGGATSGSLISDQLATAVAELEDRNGDNRSNNDVEVITVDIGGNDVFALIPVCSSGFTPACVTAVTVTFATFSGNFDFILDELRTAAGPDTTIIVMTYYNPLPSCFLAFLAPLADIVLEGGGPLPAGLNDLIRAIASTHDAEVANTFGKLGSSDLVGGFDCLHANDDGYKIIADEFADEFK
jgi:lysophospholipase L1-like esterase